MDQNELDIHLLKHDPDKLIIRYQPVIRMIIISYINRGCGHKNELQDLIQEVNRKLLERMPRIQTLYNGKSLFRTYFSVVIRNLFLEEIRKPRMVLEPDPDPYGSISRETVLDDLLIRQEIIRFERVIGMFGLEGKLIRLALYLIMDLDITTEMITEFQSAEDEQQAARLRDRFQEAKGILKKEKLQLLSQLLPDLGEKGRKPDALRKWYTTRLDEVLRLMNGNPPHASFTEETLQILLENALTRKKSQVNYSNLNGK